MTATTDTPVRPAMTPTRARRLVVLALLSLRGRIRASELWLVVIATLLGGAAGFAAVLVSGGAREMQRLLYGLDIEQRLSALSSLAPGDLLYLPIGGLVVGLMTWGWA